MIAIIAAIANGNVIGNKGQMPWGCIPRDLNHFKTLTLGRPIVMGYNTLVSVSKIFPKGKIFPGRASFVLTSDPRKVSMFSKECVALSGIDFILDIAKNECVCIIGGENVYRQFIDIADVAYITRIDADFAGDTFFPAFKDADWRRLDFESVRDGGYSLNFETWARGRKKPPISASDFEQFNTHAENRCEFISRSY